MQNLYQFHILTGSSQTVSLEATSGEKSRLKQTKKSLVLVYCFKLLLLRVLRIKDIRDNRINSVAHGKEFMQLICETVNSGHPSAFKVGKDSFPRYYEENNVTEESSPMSSVPPTRVPHVTIATINLNEKICSHKLKKKKKETNTEEFSLCSWVMGVTRRKVGERMSCITMCESKSSNSRPGEGQQKWLAIYKGQNNFISLQIRN